MKKEPRVHPHQIKTIIDDLAEASFAVSPDFLSPTLSRALRDESQRRWSLGQFREARVGKGAVVANEVMIRNDHIKWIDEEALSDSEGALFEILEELRQSLNRELYLGLKDFEAHFARYPAGHFYQRHLDRFQNDSARTISGVLYLNEDWSAANEGSLRLHLKDSQIDVTPLAGTLVLFESDKIEHEVLPSIGKERLSIAAWFRR